MDEPVGLFHAFVLQLALQSGPAMTLSVEAEATWRRIANGLRTFSKWWLVVGTILMAIALALADEASHRPYALFMALILCVSYVLLPAALGVVLAWSIDRWLLRKLEAPIGTR